MPVTDRIALGCSVALGLVIAALGPGTSAAAAEAESGIDVIEAGSAVIFTYHHVAEDTPESTSVKPDTFRAHLEHLEENDFHVWDLPRLLDALQNGDAIPDKTVALTFDDAYQSVYDEVFPLMQERDWPFTVFVATDAVDRHAIYMDWDELQELDDAGVTIANHSVSHGHMARPRPDEDRDDWLQRMEGEIVEAQDILEDKLDEPPRIFAWPYGESSPATRELLRELDFVGLGQQSGAVAHYSHDFAALPRFPMAVGFAGVEDFALKARTRPLPVQETQPNDGVLEPDAEAPSLELTLIDGPYRADAINCFARGASITREVTQQDPTMLRIQADGSLPVGRTTYTCTAPSTSDDRWFWYSFTWMKPEADGSWYGW